MRNVYAGLTVALATSLGANVFLAGNVDLKAAVTKQHCSTLTAELGAAAKSSIETFMLNNLSGEATDKFGTGVVNLTDAKINGICVRWSDIGEPEETAQIAARICKMGEWTAGAP